VAFRISIEEEQAILRGLAADNENIRKFLLTSTKQTADNLVRIHSQYPMLQPGVLLGLAKTNAPDAKVAEIAKATAAAANADPDGMNGKPKGNWLTGVGDVIRGGVGIAKGAAGAVLPDFVGTGVRAVGGVVGDVSSGAGLTPALKAVSRTGFAVLDTTNELAQNSAAFLKDAAKGALNVPSQVANTSYRAAGGAGTAPVRDVSGGVFDTQGASLSGFFGSTTIATLASNFDKQGSGYFQSEAIRKEQARRAGEFRGLTSGGHVWSIGRGAAGTIFKEGSYQYNLMSGILDGAVAVKVPATGGLGKVGEIFSDLASAGDAGKVVSTLGRTADVLQGRGVIIPLSKMDGDELREAHRLAGLVGETVDPEQANKFLGSRGGRRLVERLVDANTADDVRSLVGRNVFADTVKRLRDAKTELDVQAVLADVLGLPGEGLVRTVGVDGVHKFVISNARRTKFIESLEAVPGGKKVVRGFSKQARQIGDISSESPADVRNTINAIDNWSRLALVPENSWQLTKVAADGTETVVTMPGRRQILDQALDAMSGDSATPTARKAFKADFERTIQDTLIHQNGVDENIVRAVFDDFYKKNPKRSKWPLGLDGRVNDAGQYDELVIGNGEKISDGAFGGPMVQSELANVIIEMPDPAQVKALTSKLNWITRDQGVLAKRAASREAETLEGVSRSSVEKLSEAGTLRLPFAALTYFQENIWRRYILATGGFGVRNLNEAQIRMALTPRGIDGAYNHPISWIAWAMHKKGGYDVTGAEFTAETLAENMADFQRALQVDLYRQYGDPSIVYRRGERVDDYKYVDRRGDDAVEEIVLAHGDQLGLLNADPIARMHAAGAQEDEIINFIKNTPEGKKWFLKEQDYHINGRPVYDRTAGRYTGDLESVDLNDEEKLRTFVREITERVDAHTGGDTRLLNVVAGGQLPQETIANARNLGLSQKDVGQVVSIPTARKSKNFRQAKVVSFDDATGEAVIVPFAFQKREITGDLRRLLGDETVLRNGQLAPKMPYEIRVKTETKKSFEQRYDDLTDRIFGFLYGKPSRFLDRSPLFRQFYYETAIDQLLTGLSLADAKLLRANILGNARKTKTTPGKFLGDNKRWVRIEKAAAGEIPLTSKITLDELDAYAKGNALDEVKSMLYNATDLSNYLGAARIVAPFSAAYVDFFKSIGRMYTVPTASGMRLPNITALRKTQLVIESGREGDPDMDGRGFFFKDPNTQEWSFNYPGGGLAVKALTGLDGNQVAPISGALQGIDFASPFGLKFNPGVGPYISIASTWIMGANPEYEDFRKVLLPFGPVSVEKALVPAWLQKIVDVWQNDYKSANALGDTVLQVAEALVTQTKADGTLEYDLSNKNELVRLQNDAQAKGRILALLNATAQWTGPSRPKTDFILKKLPGSDVFATQVLADLRKWQEEDNGNGYDTAVQKFFQVYGTTYWSYLARKTATQYAGLTSTQEFEKWQYENKDFVDVHKNVAGYFAPVGTDFDWQVYARQLASGLRTKLPLEDAITEAQWTSGNGQYKMEEAKYPDPSDEDIQHLKEYKEQLKKDYPGYDGNSFDVNKIKNQIKALKDAAYFKGLDDNPVALGTREYLAFRQDAINNFPGKSTTFLAKENSDQANELKANAAKIIEKYPEFGRLYERVLSKELEN
jgi:hypothetical protein